MAREVIERITDDLDGTENAQTIQIGWQGEWREIDLGEKNLTAFAKVFDRFWDAARPVRRSAPAARVRARRTDVGGRDPRAIRAWALENGIDVPARGRIPGVVEEQYREAMRR